MVRSLGEFTLISLLGRGGMGEVWEAHQQSVDRRVALKLILPERVNERSVAYFAREARAGGRLSHPGIVSVFGMGSDEDQHWIVMELIEDAFDLDEFLDSMRSEHETPESYYREAAEFIAAVAEALHHAHQAGVVHRDLKPSNILMTPEGEPKVTDFGLAQLSGESALTRTGELAGTFRYMSPEQVQYGSAGVDYRSDIFSLGTVLYEMLSLRCPFEGDTVPQVTWQLVNQDPPGLRTIRSQIPRDLEVICAKCMAKDPERRYADMRALATDLRKHLSSEPITARPPSQFYKVRLWTRRNPWLATLSAVIALFLIVIGRLIYLDLEHGRDLVVINTQLELRTAEAVEERKEAMQRAEELQQVADFQAEQLSGVNPHAMGLTIRSMLLERAMAQGERAGRAPDVLAQQRAELERLLDGADFTGLALDVLDEELFEGTIKELESLANQPLVQAQLLQTVAGTLRKLGLLERALEPQRQALEIRRQELGDEHPDTVASILCLGALFVDQGQRARAEPLLREALEVSRRTLDDAHPGILESLNNLGILLIEQGKRDEAEPLLREAMEVSRRTLGDEHENTVDSISHLGLLLQDQGRFEEAEPLLRESLVTSRRTLGDENSETLFSINNLGQLLSLQGELDEAESLLREAVEKCRLKLGDEHRLTLISIGNLGHVFFLQDKLEEAEPLVREALQSRRRKLGDVHPDTLASINQMGFLLASQGKLDDAEPLLREALAESRRTLGDGHAGTLAPIYNLGCLLQQQGSHEEAELLVRELLELTPEESPDYGGAKQLLDDILAARQQAAGTLAEDDESDGQ